VGYTQLLELGVPDPVTSAQLHQLDRIARSAQHLLGLVNDVLDVARLDAGEMRVAHEHARVRPAVQAALAIARPLADHRGVRVATGHTGTADVHAEIENASYVGDETRVRQILVNLLSNAVKFTPPGGSVTVASGMVAYAPEAARVAGTGPWTYVSVADTGIGIAPEQHEAIFEPFMQVEVGLARSSTGTGLGLAISRRLARLMGGDLTVDSQPGVGSTFTLWLPAVAVGEAGEAGEAETSETRWKRAELSGTGWRVRGLDELGRALRDESAAILAAYTARLRADPGIPLAQDMRREQLEDHAATLIADLAQSLVLVANAGEEAAMLMRDGTTIQRTVAEQHAVRRRAQGWTEEALRRDHEILREVLEQAVRARVPTSADDASEGLRVLAWLTARAQALGLAAYRQAAEGGGAPFAPS
ncbi:MAG TPA: ATP-binding protein, partial [Gemmatimonadaceae bacterium]|nr:ATP-binding protein [Gemmatimonadaceae bacterium]